MQDKMRIFSNIFLSWPHVLHISHASRLYPGRWQNYYFYRISARNPTEIFTYSPIMLLRENREYYCYDHYYRDTSPEKLGNITEMTTINNKPASELWVTIPKACKANDVIVIHDVSNRANPNVNYSSFSLVPSTLTVLV